MAGWEGGGSRGTKIVNKNVVNKLAFPNCSPGGGVTLRAPPPENTTLRAEAFCGCGRRLVVL